MKLKENFEMNLYEHLGVKQFQKLVFMLEKVIHFKDKGKNINYHVKSKNIDELEKFKKFLYYNGAIHVRNAVVVSTLMIIQPFFFSGYTLLYLVPSLVKNIYCVMLQRYNYLRINKVIDARQKQIERKVEKKIEHFNNATDNGLVNIKDKEECLTQINNIKKFLQGEEDVFLDGKSVETLNLIRSFITETYDKENDKKEKSDNDVFVKKLGGK